MRRAESRKVVQPRQALRRLVHRFGVEYHRHPPGPPNLQRQRRPPVYDAIEVAPAHAAETRVEVVSRYLRLQDRHRLRPKLRVEPVHQPKRSDRLVVIAMRSQIGRASCRERVCQYVWIPVVAVPCTKTTHHYITIQTLAHEK